MATSHDSLLAQVRAWQNADPSASAVAELETLLKEAEQTIDEEARATSPAWLELRDRFACELEFGTAGLRGVMAAGPNRMNLAVVLRATHALATVLFAQVPNSRERGVVLGFDARLGSQEFAEAAARLLLARGFRVWLSPNACPTPVVAYAVRALGAACGIVVTASHNPPEYNGYKVYWDRGAQIVPPIDSLVQQAMAEAPDARSLHAQAAKEGALATIPDDTVAEYTQKTLALDETKASTAEVRSKLSIVYTPLHGVGAPHVLPLLAKAGFTGVVPVAEQVEADGRFPTVEFPNPEEKGAMDLAYATGKRVSAELILANDPDADRLSVAIATSDDYLQLTGNQVGVLLGAHALSRRATGTKPLVLASCVSSPMLGAMAAKLGVRYEETLTGFKWIANRAMDLEAEGYTFLFGYEEALGYCFGPHVKDKDGVSAALVLAELAAIQKQKGQTLLDLLGELYATYGWYESGQITLTRKGVAGKAQIDAIMRGLRGSPPSAIAGDHVVAFSDASTGLTRRGVITEKMSLPSSNVLFWQLASGSRVIARPSGTEPKLKLYLDVCVPVAAHAPSERRAALNDAKIKAATALATMRADMQRLAEQALQQPS
jgi:phosphomannomutase